MHKILIFFVFMHRIIHLLFFYLAFLQKLCYNYVYHLERRCCIMVLNVYITRGPEPTDLDDLIFSDDTWTPSDK